MNTENRFYITTEYGWGSVGSPCIRDRTTGEIVCEDVYDTLHLLNELANKGGE